MIMHRRTVSLAVIIRTLPEETSQAHFISSNLYSNRECKPTHGKVRAVFELMYAWLRVCTVRSAPSG